MEQPLTTVLGQEIPRRGFESVESGNPMELKKGIEKPISIITEELGKQPIVVGSDYDKIKQIATISKIMIQLLVNLL